MAQPFCTSNDVALYNGTSNMGETYVELRYASSTAGSRAALAI